MKFDDFHVCQKQEFLKIELSSSGDVKKISEFTQSLGVSWVALSVICQVSLALDKSKSVFLGLVVFNLLNTGIIFINLENLTDVLISGLLGCLSIYALKQSYSNRAIKEA
jgi:hypothetical protein